MGNPVLTWSLALLVLFVGYAELHSTKSVLNAGGRELNPIMRRVQARTGRHWGMVKVSPHAAIAAAVIFIDNTVTSWIVLIAISLNAWVVMNNFRMARRQSL